MMEEIQDIYTLSPLQQGLLFHSVYAKNSAMYVTQMAVTINGDLDIAAFSQAWQQVINRHTILRTGFLWDETERPLQVVYREVDVNFQRLDWRHLSPASQPQELADWLEQDRYKDFEISEAPLIRLTLIQTAEQTYEFIWTYHHVLLDGWSLPIVLNEVFSYYRALVSGETIKLATPRPYRDYIAWLRKQDQTKAETFWRNSLKGFTTPTSLEMHREATGETGFKTISTTLSRWTTEMLHRLAREHSLTVNTIIQGAWALLLHRYSGARDLLYGTTVSGRPTELNGVEQMVGLFINTLPMRISIPQGESLLNWLKELQAQQLEMRQYEYSSLIDIHGWSEVPRGTPLFHSLFVYENYPLGDSAGGQGNQELELSNLRAVEQTNYPLTLVCAPGQEILLKMMYDRSQFSEDAVNQILRHLSYLIEQMVIEVKQPLERFSLLMPAERQRILQGFNQTALDYPRSLLIQHLFEEQVERTPEAPALVWGEEEITYAELNQRANQVAHYLRELGVGTETLVGLWMERSPELIIGLLAILKAGGAYVPLDPAYPQERITYILQQSGTNLLLTDSSLTPRLADSKVRQILIDQLPERFIQSEQINPISEGLPQHLAYVIYTSGSTGHPKGVMIEHRNVVSLLAWARQTFKVDELQGVLASTSICFDLSVFELFLPLSVGGTVILADSALQLPDLPARHRVTLLNTVPSAATELLRLQGIPASVRVVNLAGEPLPNHLAQQLYQLGTVTKVYNLYGPSEDTTYSTYVLVEKGGRTAPPIGRPIANTEAYVLDQEMRPLPVGVPGELYLAGEGLSRGYYQRPDLTEERFLPHPFQAGKRVYRTGDLVSWQPDGKLAFLGRLDHQVKIRGFRIELGEIEEVLRQHPFIAEAVVVAREERLNDKRLVAYLVLHQQQEDATVDWQAFLAQKLPEYMIPSLFVTLDALPLTPNGKIDRKALPLPEQINDEQYVAPETETEEMIANIWSEVLQIERIGRYDHFFRLGGHSLLATQVLSRLRERLGWEEIPLQILFTKATVIELGQWLDEQQSSGEEKQMIVPIDRPEGKAPASYAQQRLWLIEQLSTDQTAYSLPFAIRIQGGLQVDALEQSFFRLIERHQSLRTIFAEQEGKLWQIILDQLDWCLPVFDLRQMTHPEQRAKEMIEEHIAHPFNLEQGPLLRAGLFHLREDDWILFVNMHHIISDGWSLSVLQKELFSLYRAIVQGEQLQLPQLPIQYADYAEWQRGWLQAEPLEQQLTYWREQLAGELPVLQLPTDFPRPVEQSFHGAHLQLSLPSELTERLHQISQQEEATLFMTLLATFQLLLSRYSGQTDLIVGSPIAGRTRQETEGLIGFFVNTLAFRTDLGGNPTFRQLLTRVRQTALEAFAHQDVPFEKVVDEVQPERSLSHSALFQAMFVLQNLPFAGEQLADLQLAPFEFTHVTAKFDLTLTMLETDQGLLANFEYNTDLFRQETIERMARHFQQLLKGIVADPDQPIGYLPILTNEEATQLQVWSKTRTNYPRHASLSELFVEQVERTPEAIALVNEAETFTYQELNRRANQLAHYLRKQGVGIESKVGILMERSPDLILSLLAITKAGGAYVPFNPADPIDRLQSMMETAEINWLLTQSELQERIPVTNAMVMTIEQVWKESSGESRHNPLVETTGDHLAYVMFTSGSTGIPKGVEAIQRGIVRLVKGANYLRFNADDVFLQLAPVSFDASTLEIWGSLLNGAKLVLMPPETPSLEAIAEALQQYQVSTLWLTAGLFHLMVEQQLTAFRALRYLLVGGDVISVPHVKQVLSLGSVQVINGYGPTENTTFTCCYPVPAAWDGHISVPIGRPISNTEVYILDRHRQPVPIGVPGELYTGGDGLARGYCNHPELTEDRFVPHPFAEDPTERLYRTGDLVRYLPDGNIEFLGRLDYQVKIRGFRIELGEVEAAIRQHPAVQETVVVVHQGETGKRLVAYLVANCTSEEMRSFLKESLPEYMVPSAFILLDELPLTPNGKIDRQALPKIDDRLFSGEGEYVAPRSEIEQSLVSLWCEVLRVKQVGIHDNFFSLGGDSILSIQIVSKAKQRGLHFTPKQIFEHQTIAELASVVQQSTTYTAQQDVVSGEVPFLPIQHWFFEQQLKQPQHFNQAVMFTVAKRMRPEWVKETVAHLQYHHDALRLTYVQREDKWQQVIAKPTGEVPVSFYDLSDASPAEQTEQITAIANQVQAGFSLEAGPLWKVVYFKLGDQQSDRLLIVAHHLLVDGVSWRILLEDFQTIYQQLEQGVDVCLPAKTTSYQQWATELIQYAKSENMAESMDYWNQETDEFTPLPVDFPMGTNTERTTESLQLALTAAETRALLKQVPQAYRTQINEVLLTALVRAISTWSNQRTIWVEMEGHGREEINEGIDLSRTVGWFTSLYPVAIPTTPGDSLIESLRRVKEQIRKIPQRGLGYGLLRYLRANQLPVWPQPEISFNYLGQFTQGNASDSFFGGAPESVGETIHPDEVRTYLLEVTGLVTNNQFVINWKYSREKHHRQTIAQVAKRFIDELRQLIIRSETEVVSSFTPSDFPLAKLTEEQMATIVKEESAIENIYLATPLQQGMLFHSIYASEKGDYITQVAFTLIGKLDMDALQQAWKQLVDRHTILRTSFVMSGLDQPHQLVHKQVTIKINQFDWRQKTTTEQQQHLQAFMEEDRRQGFDLDQPPLMRISLFRLTEESYRLVWTHHHILLDGWSLSLVLKEVLSTYLKVEEFAASPAYEKYIAWLQQQSLPKAEQYWRNKLAGFTAPTRIALAKPTNQQSAHREQRLHLEENKVMQLQQLAQKQQLTFNTVVQTAWALLLSYLSGEDDVVFGVTSSGRPAELPEVEQMVGLFINTLPMRTKLDGRLSFFEWAKQIQAEQSEMQTYEYTPLVDIQGWSELPRGLPLFETLFIFENYPIQEVTAEDPTALSITDLYINEQNNLPLTVTAGFDQQLLLKVMYDPAYYEDKTINRMLGYLKTILEQVIETPQLPLNRWRMIPEEEQRLVIQEWNHAIKKEEDPVTLVQMFIEQVERTPEAIAVEWEGKQLTYRELNQRTNQLAHYLQGIGVGPDQLVGICLERNINLIVAILGVLKAGGAYVPLDPHYPADRIAYMLEHSGAKVVLTQQSLCAQMPVKDLLLISLDQEWGWIAATTSQTEVESQVTAKHPAYVIYTSGSTGLPKGVVIEHRSVVELMRWAHEQFTIDELQGVLFSTSICFDLSVYELFAPLTMGGTVIIAENALLLSQMSPVQPITLINSVPSIVTEVLRATTLPSSVRVVNLCGEPLPRLLVEQLYAIQNVEKVYNIYGPTEDTVYSSVELMAREQDSAPPIGRPIRGTQMYVLDAHLRPVPVGVPGELHIAGAGLARGYLHQPDLTAERFIPNPFHPDPEARMYKTGDLVRWNEQGILEYIGRIDHQVKVRGFRIELGEIETVLTKHQAVQEAVVVALEDHLGSKQLVAYMVLQQNDSIPTLEQWRAYVEQKLPDYMVPAHFIVLDSFPQTPNGKIDRKALPRPEMGSQAEAYEPPRNQLEQELVEIWEEVLQVKPIGIHDHFFTIGGHSLIALTLMTRIHELLQVELPLATLLSSPTIAYLAEKITNHTAKNHQPLILLQQGNEATAPLFLIHPQGGGIMSFYPLAQQWPEQTIYGIQSVGYDWAEKPLTSVEEMANRYLKEIMQVQPVGPYYLAGWSFGGLIAFEITKRLEASGQQVAWLGLLDSTWIPGNQVDRFRQLLSDPYLLREQARQWNLELEPLRQAAKLSVEKLVELSLTTTNPVERKAIIWLLNGHAYASYKITAPIQSDLYQFIAKEKLLWAGSHDWQSHTSGNVHSFVVPGNHVTMFDQPHATHLANVIKESIQFDHVRK